MNLQKNIKKNCIFSFVFLVCILFVFILSACSKPSNFSVYTREGVEDGVTYFYTLSLDEARNTFSISRQSNPEKVYSGTFTFENGYLKLTSKQYGVQYVKLTENSFSFFNIESNTDKENCNHDFKVIETFSGNCKEKAYEKQQCTKCKTEKIIYKDYGPHDYKIIEKNSGDCVHQGFIKKKCTICGKEIVENTGKYGEHKFEESEQIEIDEGCDKKVKLRSRCKICGKIKEVELEKYGKHKYNEQTGICEKCGYDSSGICHIETDKNLDRKHDIYDLDLEITRSLKEKGYYLSLDKNQLYFGAYPDKVSSFSASEIKKDGKYDLETGYYRYNNASYKLVSKFDITENKEKELAFLVSPILWTRKTIGGQNRYVCTKILEKHAYLEESNMEMKRKDNGDNTYSKVYYNKQYIKDEILANDFEKSSLQNFIQNEFQNIAFTARQREFLIKLAIPDKTAIDENIDFSDIKMSDYYEYISTEILKNAIFTSVQSIESNKVKIIGTTENSDAFVTTQYGFLPVLTFSTAVK